MSKIYVQPNVVSVTVENGVPSVEVSFPGPQGAPRADGSGGGGGGGAGYGGTSTTTVSYGSGTKTFTTQTGLAYVAGSRVRAADPTFLNWLEGTVTSYSGSTLVILSDLWSGAGTNSFWAFSIAGVRGATGATGPAPSGTGLVSVTAGALDTPTTLRARVSADAANLRSDLGLGTSATLNVPATGNAASGEVVKGSDTRLTDSRTPTSHTHTASDVTDFSEAVDDRVALLIQAGTNVTTSYNDAAGTLTINASVSGGGGGDVVGPASATDGVPALFDGVTGKLLKSSTPTGTGNPVRSNSPTLVTPALGTPTILTLTNATGLPTTGIDGVATNTIIGRSTAGTGPAEQITCTAAGRALIDDADAAAQRTTLGLGTLATQNGTFSGTSSGTNTGDQTITLSGDASGSGTGAITVTIANSAVTLAKMANMATASIIGRSTAGTGAPEVLSASAVRTLLSLVPGTDVQAFDSDLSAVAALSSNGIIARTGTGTASVRTITGPAAGLTVTNGDGVSGNPTLALANDLSAIEALNTNGILKRTGTDTWGAITAWPVEFCIKLSDETTAITTGTNKARFRAPFAFTLTAVRAAANTAPTGSTIIIDINESGATVLSTKLSIDASENTSTTAASAAVISDSAIADDAEISFDFDQVGSTVAGAGISVWLIGTKTLP